MKNKLFFYGCTTILVVISILVVLFSGKGRIRNAIAPDLKMEKATIVVDPGHGGADGGAVSLTGVSESQINLAIAKKLDQVLGFYGYPVVMTRNAEELDYPEEADTIRKKKVYDTKNRLALIQSVDNAVLVSVHQNKFGTAAPAGAQVFYAPSPGSDQLSEKVHLSLYAALPNVRTAKQIPENIYIMNHVTCPAILVECGYLSNPGEEELLRSYAYQLRLAVGIAGGCISALG